MPARPKPGGRFRLINVTLHANLKANTEHKII